MISELQLQDDTYDKMLEPDKLAVTEAWNNLSFRFYFLPMLFRQ